MDWAELLERVRDAAAADVGQGYLPEYIPALRDADAKRFAIAIATLDGEVHGCGDWDEPFSVQSIAKVFALALAIDQDGRLWSRVGREPSGDPFNSLVQLEYDRGIPRNPFMNAGALVVVDRLLSLTGDSYGAVLQFVREESGVSTLARTRPSLRLRRRTAIGTPRLPISSKASATSTIPSTPCSSTTSVSRH